MEDPVHITALVESPEHVCCRYRVQAFRPYLEAAGHRLEVVSRPRSWWAWLRVGHTLRKADAVILQRKLLAPWPLYALRRAARRLIFDFDDAVFLRDSYAPRGMVSARRRRRFAAMVRAADAVAAGNRLLHAHAVLEAVGARVRVIPTCVDPARYPVAEHRRAEEGVELVWVGSSSTLRGLDEIRPVLEGLGQA